MNIFTEETQRPTSPIAQVLESIPVELYVPNHQQWLSLKANSKLLSLPFCCKWVSGDAFSISKLSQRLDFHTESEGFLQTSTEKFFNSNNSNLLHVTELVTWPCSEGASNPGRWKLTTGRHSTLIPIFCWHQNKSSPAGGPLLLLPTARTGPLNFQFDVNRI